MKINIKLNISKAINAANKAKSSNSTLCFSALWLVSYAFTGHQIALLFSVMFVATSCICRAIENK
jgi:hypothetical protein